MLCTAMLFLLLLSSCLSQTDSPDAPNQRTRREKMKDDLKKANSWFKSNYRRIGEFLATIVAPVPLVGAGIAAGLRALMQIIPKMPDILQGIPLELKALHVKLDSVQSEMRWDAWAAAAYQAPADNIEKAWHKYTELQKLSSQASDVEKQALQRDFYTLYSQYTDSTSALNRFLMAKPDSIKRNLGELLTDRLRCHEKAIAESFKYLNTIICQGYILDKNYYKFTVTDAERKVSHAQEIASQSASALALSHQKCVSNSAQYIERDIFERIDDSQDHQELSNRMRDFLVETYDRYDWMVVTFTTQFSSDMPKAFKKHDILGFTEVKRGSVTVAVAKQVKGGHAKAGEVKQAIQSCLQDLRICTHLVEKLKKCQVFGKSLLATLTAVHSYTRNNQTSTSATLDPHVYEGKCKALKLTKVRFIILIKSDEEIIGEDPCSKVNCGRNGECVRLSGTLIGMCKCRFPFYGDRCEMSCEIPERRPGRVPIRDLRVGQTRRGPSTIVDPRRPSQTISLQPQRSAPFQNRKRNSKGSAI